MRTHSFVWLLLMVAILIFSPLMLSPNDYRKVVYSEFDDAVVWYGLEEAERIADNANSFYRITCVQTGLHQFVTKYLPSTTPKPDEISNAMKRSGEVNQYFIRVLDYGASLLANINLFCFRLAHASFWLVYILPFLAAVIFDGIMTRRVKLESFRYTSPSVYNFSWHLIILIFASAIVGFALCVYHPIWLYPVGLIVAGVMLRLVICNIQHSA